jgi:hypothetical protein
MPSRIIKHDAPVDPRDSEALQYYVNVYRGDEFVVGLEFAGYSGTAVHEELRYLRETSYPGCTFEW